MNLKAYFETQFRHLLTSLAALLVAFFLAHHMAAADVQQVQTASTQAIEPIAAICALVAVFVVRHLILWLGEKFPSLSTLLSGLSGRIGLLAMGCTAVALMGFCGTSCSPEQIAAARAIPINIGIHTDDGDLGYSSKSGISVSANARRAVTADK